MSHSQLDVYLGQEYLGQLSKEGRDYVFKYTQNAQADVSLTMPRREAEYRFPELHPIFQMHLPEGPARQVLSHVITKSEGHGDLTLLRSLSDNQNARIRYAEPGKPLSPAKQDKQEATNAEKLFAQLMGQHTKNSTQANMQPRINASLQGKTALPSAFYVIKTWGNEYPELACNEYACLEFAKHMGLNTPEYQLSDKGKTLLSVRFDAQKGEIPLGFEDFAVLQGKTPAQRYDSSLEACAKTLRTFVSAEHRPQALQDFFKLILLNTVIRNGDAHLKNLGIIYHSRENRTFAPVFDLTTTTAYLPDDFMALRLNGNKNWPSKAELMQFGQTHCQLSKTELEQCFITLSEAFLQARKTLHELIQMRPEFKEMAERMDVIWLQAYQALEL